MTKIRPCLRTILFNQHANKLAAIEVPEHKKRYQTQTLTYVDHVSVKVNQDENFGMGKREVKPERVEESCYVLIANPNQLYGVLHIPVINILDNPKNTIGYWMHDNKAADREVSFARLYDSFGVLLLDSFARQSDGGFDCRWKDFGSTDFFAPDFIRFQYVVDRREQTLEARFDRNRDEYELRLGLGRGSSFVGKVKLSPSPNLGIWDVTLNAKNEYIVNFHRLIGACNTKKFRSLLREIEDGKAREYNKDFVDRCKKAQRLRQMRATLFPLE